MVKRVIFDFNGVISNDAYWFYILTWKLVQHFGGYDFTFGDFRENFSQNYSMLYRSFGAKAQEADFRAYWNKEAKNILPHIQIFQDIPEIVSWLAQQNISISVLSSFSGGSDFVEEILRKHGLRLFFKEVRVIKPSERKEEALIQMTDAEGMAAEDTLVIDDLDVFLSHIKPLGFIAVGHDRGYVCRRRLESASTYVISNFIPELQAYILKLNGNRPIRRYFQMRSLK